MSTPTPRKGALLFIFLTVLIDSIGFGIIIPVLPRLIVELTGVTIGRAAELGGWLSFVYAIMQMICAPILGNLSDALGRRPVILFALLALGLDYVVMGFAPTLGWLFLGRTIAGVAGASFTPAYAYIADISPPELRARRFGFMGAAFGLGFIIGPAVGGLLVAFGPRAPFYVAAGFSLVNAMLGFFALPESLPVSLRRPFVWTRAHPLATVRQVGHYPAVGWLLLAVFLWQLGHQVLPNVWSYYTMAKFHWSGPQIGASLAFVGVMMVLAQGVVNPLLIPRLGGEQRAGLVGLVFCGLTYTGYALATEGWMLYASAVAWLVAAIANPCMNALMSRQVPPDAQGELQGAIASLYGLSSILGPPLMTQIFGYFSDGAPGHPYFPGAPFISATLLVVASVASYLRAVTAVRTPAQVPAA